MAEWKLFEGDVPHVSTFDYHKDRERAPHAEQSDHRVRLLFTRDLVLSRKPGTVIDLGCGDGGLVQMLRETLPGTSAIAGFDFAPANAEGWTERGVNGICWQLNVFPEPPGPVINEGVEGMLRDTDVAVMTEILEHLARPHEVLRRIKSNYLVASSPWNEDNRVYDESHAWAWDLIGYRRMIVDAGFDILEHRVVEASQLVLAVRR